MLSSEFLNLLKTEIVWLKLCDLKLCDLKLCDLKLSSERVCTWWHNQGLQEEACKHSWCNYPLKIFLWSSSLIATVEQCSVVKYNFQMCSLVLGVAFSIISGTAVTLWDAFWRCINKSDVTCTSSCGRCRVLLGELLGAAHSFPVCTPIRLGRGAQHLDYLLFCVASLEMCT
jgi:hypothetical protein